MKDLMLVISNSCGCEYCGKNIPRGRSYFVQYKNAVRGTARINVCIMCIEKLYKMISKKELRIAKKELLVESLK